jgi:hypothetical protein
MEVKSHSAVVSNHQKQIASFSFNTVKPQNLTGNQI